jgi:ATP-dependent Lon protease
MAAALISALSGRKIRREVAMTGEITLRGRVLPIGGLKQKVMAAHRAGVTTVIFPAKNLKDLEEIPDDVRQVMTLIPVDHMDEVVQQALLDRPSAADVMKYAHFDAILLPGLETGWQTPPAPAG